MLCLQGRCTRAGMACTNRTSTLSTAGLRSPPTSLVPGNVVFIPCLHSTPNVCQGRLGTNIGNVEKQDDVSFLRQACTRLAARRSVHMSRNPGCLRTMLGARAPSGSCTSQSCRRRFPRCVKTTCFAPSSHRDDRFPQTGSGQT